MFLRFFLLLTSSISLLCFSHPEANPSPCASPLSFLPSLPTKTILRFPGIPPLRHFMIHTEKGQEYVSLSFPDAAPFKNLLDQLNQGRVLPLKGRGEAHITLITPPEYVEIQKLLGDKMPLLLGDLRQAATNLDLETISLEVKGLGTATPSPEIAQKKKMLGAETFFLVIHSDVLLEFRKRTQEAVEKQGGDPSSLQLGETKNFSPHITIGFTHTDLFPGVHGSAEQINKKRVNPHFELQYSSKRKPH